MVTNMRILLILLTLLLSAPCYGWEVVYRSSAASGGGASISYESYASANGSSDTPTINTPSGTSDGDLLVVTLNNDNSADFTYTGWTLIQLVSNYSSADLLMAYKTASNEGATQTFGLATAGEWAGVIVRLSKSSGTWNIDDSDGSGETSADTVAFTGLTSTTPGMLLFGMGSDDAVTITTAPTDMTEVVIETPASSRAGMWYESVSAGSNDKTIISNGGDIAGTIVAIGLN